jgi:hypothetical protein
MGAQYRLGTFVLFVAVLVVSPLKGASSSQAPVDSGFD